MNAVIALCHFCELHGPSILFCTQPFHEIKPLNEVLAEKKEKKTFYGNPDHLKLQKLQGEKVGTCEGCHSLASYGLGYISNDHDAQVSFLSTQHPTHHEVASLVRQACVRSLSCEVCPGKEGPVFFGEDRRANVLSYTFFLKDSQARGFHRWYSIIIVMRDRFFLLNSWPFFVDHVKSVISELQAKAEKVYNAEQAECPQRALRLTAAGDPDNFLKQQSSKPIRSLVDITQDKSVFARLHLWFTWLLRAGANRLHEKLVDALPMKDWLFDFAQQEETEEGFTLVTARETLESSERDLEASGSCEIDQVDPVITNVRHLRQLMGHPQFLMLAYNLVVGNQVVIRGQPSSFVTSIIKSLKVLVPRGCYRPVCYSSEYLDLAQCNLIGLEPHVAAPQPSPDILRLDILLPEDKDITMLDSYKYIIKWGGKLPRKCPTFLTKVEKALENPLLSESVLHYHFVALKEEWLNIAKVVARTQKSGSPNSPEVVQLMKVLGAHDHDRQLLDFWGSCSSQWAKSEALEVAEAV